MGRRQTKARLQMGVASRVTLGTLTPQEGEQFRVLYAKCRSPEDFEQVHQALDSFCAETVPTRYTRIRDDDDFLGDDDL